MMHISTDGGSGNSKHIFMDVNEMQEMMRLMTSLEVSFQTVLAPKLQTLSTLNYYIGGEAAKTLDYYSDILNKVNEVGDLYSRANSEIFNVMSKWLEVDEELAQKFYGSLDPNSQLVKNLEKLNGGES